MNSWALAELPTFKNAKPGQTTPMTPPTHEYNLCGCLVRSLMTSTNILSGQLREQINEESVCRAWDCFALSGQVI